MVLLEGQTEFLRDFFRGGLVAQLLAGSGNGGLDLFGPLPLLPGRPIQTAQAVQDGPPDLVFGIGLELDFVRRVEMVDG